LIKVLPGGNQLANNISIRKRLNWYVFAAMLALIVVTGMGVYNATTDEADEIFDAEMAQIARMLEHFINTESITANSSQLQKNRGKTSILQPGEPHKYREKLFFVIRDGDGNNLIDPGLAPDLSMIKNSPGYQRLELEGNEWIIYTRKSNQQGIWIIIGEQADIRSEINEHLGSALLVPLFLLLPVILFLLWKIVGLALKPLHSVVDQVRRQDITRLTQVEADGIPEEIEPLIAALNQMIVKLDAGYGRERRFVSDASHELRNPLAALLINVDNAIEENQNPEPGDSLLSMKLSIIRLSHLVRQLFELSHSEIPLVSQNFEIVDIVSLCQRVAESHSEAATQKHQTLNLKLPTTECSIKGVEPLLSSLVSNLLDNAIKYCADGSEIRLGIELENKDLILSFDDSGEGLDADTCLKVTGRFYRAGNTGATGAGLGLSIVKTIADLHSATMQLTRSELGGLSVSIRFLREVV